MTTNPAGVRQRRFIDVSALTPRCGTLERPRSTARVPVTTGEDAHNA
jgi:hypothetical protein